MKIIGWIGTILFAPFYFLYHAIDKLKMVYWIPAGVGAYCAYLFFLAVKSVIDDGKGYSWNSDFWETVFFVAIVGGIMIIALAILGYLIYMSWLLLSALNVAVYAVIVTVLTPFLYGFTYCNAWRQGMSRYELEGKLAYINHEKELRKQELKAKKEAKKERMQRKKQEQYAKGYQNQREKHTGTRHDSRNTTQNYSQYKNSYGKQQYEQKQKQQQEQQKKFHNQQYVDSEYYAALSLFMLEEGYTLEELKKQRNRLMKTFHPDEDDVQITKYAQKINHAFEILKARA